MPRQLRIEYPGAIYHVMSRGDRREDIYVDDVDRLDFIKTLAEACLKTEWQVHAYCLMRNHFHLVIETPAANLVGGMHWLLSAYTIGLNHRHQSSGHVFSGRYKALIVEGSGGYLKTVCDYVHLNPVRAGLLAKEERLLSYPWSSLVWYMAAREHRPGWMRVDRLLGEHGIGRDTAAGRRQFENRMEARRLEEEDDESLKPVRRGWCLGSREFREQMLEKAGQEIRPSHSGELRQESAALKAGRIVREELRRLGWQESELERRRKNDPDKLAMAARLRRETILPIKSIAALVRLGTSKSANTKLRAWMQQDTSPKARNERLTDDKTNPT